MEQDNSTAQMDNSTAPDLSAAEAGIINTPQSESISATAGLGTWKSTLRTDLRDSQLSKKFDDTPEGLNQMTESYANLEKLLGHDKIPVPKDAGDVEGWNRFSKAMGIPDKAEGYGLPDAVLPESMKGMTIDKNQFADVMHAHKVHPSAVKGIWETYQKMNIDSYQQAMDGYQKELTNTVNSLKGEWGDAYQGNVELGQMVINKFSDSQESNDYITTILTKSPQGIKFLAKIGEQFAENKVGEFSMKRFTLTPDELMDEVNTIKKDMEGPYVNQSGKHSAREHSLAVDRVNGMIGAAMRGREGR